jgi:hypothetical protein
VFVPSICIEKIGLECERTKGSIKPRPPSVSRQWTRPVQARVFHPRRRLKDESDAETGQVVTFRNHSTIKGKNKQMPHTILLIL